MSTAEEIRAQISAAQLAIHDKQREKAEALLQREQALERQQLRKELQRLQGQIRDEEVGIKSVRQHKDWIDQDLWNRWGPEVGDQSNAITRRLARPDVQASAALDKNEKESTSSSIVAKAEYLWKIGEISWLVEALKQDARDCIFSSNFECGDSTFIFQYTPSGGDEGTLAIWHDESRSGGITFRYRIFIRRRGGEFVQWGETGNVCILSDDLDTTDVSVFGPDVPADGGVVQQGVFGMSHKALLGSEWVENDTLTVRFELAVRLGIAVEDMPKVPHVDVPANSFATDILSLLDTGRCSDVKIVVEGETILAHSPILCARSDVFDRLLNGGMAESVSKQVTIDDCSAHTFKAVLRFLYTGDLSRMEDAMQSEADGSRTSSSETRRTWLQSLLAVSHKYALLRLQAWCEQQLCECISINDVCWILCQAHLLEAKQLADACLNFIKQHFAAVIVTDAFGTLAKEWPEVMVKINIWTVGVSETSARPAIEASLLQAGKRKRDE